MIDYCEKVVETVGVGGTQERCSCSVQNRKSCLLCHGSGKRFRVTVRQFARAKCAGCPRQQNCQVGLADPDGFVLHNLPREER